MANRCLLRKRSPGLAVFGFWDTAITLNRKILYLRGQSNQLADVPF